MVSYPYRRLPAGAWLLEAPAVVVLTFDLDAESPILAENEPYAEDLGHVVPGLRTEGGRPPPTAGWLCPWVSWRSP